MKFAAQRGSAPGETISWMPTKSKLRVNYAFLAIGDGWDANTRIEPFGCVFLHAVAAVRGEPPVLLATRRWPGGRIPGMSVHLVRSSRLFAGVPYAYDGGGPQAL